MLPFKLVYHDGYDLHLGPHVFPSQKFRLVRDALLAERRLADPSDFLAPEPATDEDVLRVHTPEYVDKLKNDTLSATERMRSNSRTRKKLVEAFWLAAGGSILAGHCALEDGFAANIGGGFHHAFPGHGEGFCMITTWPSPFAACNPTAPVRNTQVMVVDTDVHQGNGTAAIFAADSDASSPSPFIRKTIIRCPNSHRISTSTWKMRRETKNISNCSVQGLREAFRALQAGLDVLRGGADPYREDQLGGLWLTLGRVAQA